MKDITAKLTIGTPHACNFNRSLHEPLMTPNWERFRKGDSNEARINGEDRRKTPRGRAKRRFNHFKDAQRKEYM